MAGVVSCRRVLNFKFFRAVGFLTMAMIPCAIAQSEPVSASNTGSVVALRTSDGPGLDELRDHAAAIDQILAVASERVDRLAADGATSSGLMEAIRQELSLSRRWNRHLASILHDVAEARLALRTREREAAKEIARMTAVAEEARLELEALKKVLDRETGEAAPAPEERSDRQIERTPAQSVAAIDRRDLDAVSQDLAGDGARLEDARAALDVMRAAQRSAIGDIDAVRAKIIEALTSLGDATSEPPSDRLEEGANLSSEDITAWAVSTAVRLGRPGGADPAATD